MSLLMRFIAPILKRSQGRIFFIVGKLSVNIRLIEVSEDELFLKALDEAT